MPRIQSTSAASGTSPYTFPYNPTQYDSQDSQNANSVELLHGSMAWQKKAWDSRPRTMLWRLIGATSTVDAIGRSQMNDTMRNWVGTIRYFNFQDLNRINQGWPTTSTWKKARVVDLINVVRPGGQLRYETTELVIVPEQ